MQIQVDAKGSMTMNEKFFEGIHMTSIITLQYDVKAN